MSAGPQSPQTNEKRNIQFVENLDELLSKEPFEPEPVLVDDPLTTSAKVSKFATDRMKAYVDKEWEKFGFYAQQQRDAEVWYQTLKNPGIEARGDLLRRLFCVLRFGGFVYRSNSYMSRKKKKTEKKNLEKGDEKVDVIEKESTSEALKEEVLLNKDSEDLSNMKWKYWYDSSWPIATALSHGGRIIIQLPKAKTPLNNYSKEEGNSQYDYTFWKWLLTGNKDGDLSQALYIGKSGESSKADKKVIFKRLGATHGLSFVPDPSDPSYNHLPPFEKELLDGRKKVLIEEKTSGFNFRDTKIFVTEEYTFKHHRHWGGNIPLGGEGNKRMTGQYVSANGSHGHLYFYMMAPKVDQYGGLMVGLEGSEWGRYGAVGDYHGVSAKSAPYSPTFGYKWFAKKHRDLRSTKGPGKYDCMFVDLTDGWEYLIEVSKTWRDEWVKETSVPIQGDPKWLDLAENKPRKIPRMKISQKRLMEWNHLIDQREKEGIQDTS